MNRPGKTPALSPFFHSFFLITFFIVLLQCPVLSAQPREQKTGETVHPQLTLDRIFSGNEFRIRHFGPTHWYTRGKGYTRLEKTAVSGLKGHDIVLYQGVALQGKILVSARQLVAPGSADPLEIADYSWSDDGQWLMIFTNTRRVWRQNTRGDYWVVNTKSGALWKIGADAPESSLMFCKFSPDSRRVAYVSRNNLFVETLSEKAQERQVIQLTRDGSQTKINGTFDWVYEEEFALRDGFRWAPDSRHIAFWQLDSSKVRTFHLINNTDTLYPVLIPIPYPKVGTANSSCRLGIVSTDGGDISWVELSGDPAEHYIPRMDWADSPNEIIFQRMNRLQNVNELIRYDIRTQSSQIILKEQDEAWLDAVDDLKWLNKGKQFTWISDRDGWQHIYVISRDGRNIRCITPGAYDVIQVVHIDDVRGWVYFMASPENPTQKYLFRVPLDGNGRAERLTPRNMPGWHSYRISPDGRLAFHTWSRFAEPPATQLISLPSHKGRMALEKNETLFRTLAATNRPEVEFFEVDIGDGIVCNAWMMKPSNFDENKKYPVLFYVYGEPWNQTVMDSYSRNYPWYTLLTEKGYIVVSVDNRGTPQPRGREWRKCVYRQIGILASADQAAAARAILASRPYIDPERVGIWGWSGGGSMTLNLMFRHPELYKTGMAVAPVPDMHLYDTIYQERYMGLPKDNVAGYRDGSPITFAEQLKGNLLIVHGTGDDNVHYQGTERLINKLIAADKHFTMMAYPNRSHGIYEGTNTTLHLYRLLTRYLTDHLEAGGK